MAKRKWHEAVHFFCMRRIRCPANSLQLFPKTLSRVRRASFISLFLDGHLTSAKQPLEVEASTSTNEWALRGKRRKAGGYALKKSVSTFVSTCIQ